jgi:hypothetical protein
MVRMAWIITSWGRAVIVRIVIDAAATPSNSMCNAVWVLPRMTWPRASPVPLVSNIPASPTHMPAPPMSRRYVAAIEMLISAAGRPPKNAETISSEARRSKKTPFSRGTAMLIDATAPAPMVAPKSTSRSGRGMFRSQKRAWAQPSTNSATTARLPARICQGEAKVHHPMSHAGPG